MSAQTYGRGAPSAGIHIFLPWSAAFPPGNSRSERQLMASPRSGHVAAHADTRNRCAGSVHDDSRREHVVLQDEVLRVRPVVRDLLGRVVPHDVGLSCGPASGLPARVVVGTVLAAVADLLQRPHVPVHLTAVLGDPRSDQPVRTAGVEQVRVVVRPLAMPGLGIGDADVDVSVRVSREAVGAGERAEVVIERTVLLHDHDDVRDVVDADVGVDRWIERRLRRSGDGRRRRPSRARPGRRPARCLASTLRRCSP